jgi:hypothetical protein
MPIGTRGPLTLLTWVGNSVVPIHTPDAFFVTLSGMATGVRFDCRRMPVTA